MSIRFVSDVDHSVGELQLGLDCRVQPKKQGQLDGEYALTPRHHGRQVGAASQLRAQRPRPLFAGTQFGQRTAREVGVGLARRR